MFNKKKVLEIFINKLNISSNMIEYCDTKDGYCTLIPKFENSYSSIVQHIKNKLIDDIKYELKNCGLKD